MLKIGHLAIVGMLLLAFAPPAAAQFAPPVQPEAASGLAARRAVVAKRQMVVAANPLATEAGLDILNAGGSAVDAAIAVQLVLNVVEPGKAYFGSRCWRVMPYLWTILSGPWS